MSMTLNLMDTLLNSGRHLSEIGRTQEAIDVLTRLREFRSLSADVLEESNALLADLYMRRGNYTIARRHLSAALAVRPLNGVYHYQMAVAIENDERADITRAEMYYAKAVELEPDQAAFWSNYGSYLLRAGKRPLGLKAIRKAYELGMDDLEIVEQVARCLRQEGCHDEAGAKLQAVLFHHRGDSRFRDLWHRHQFQVLAHAQEVKHAAATGRPIGPDTLPFLNVHAVGESLDVSGRTIRMDPAEPLNSPRTPVEQPSHRPPPKG